MECIVCIRNYFVKQSLQLDLSVTPALTLVIPFSTSTWPISSRGWLHAYETEINLSLMVIRSFDYAKLKWKTIRFMFRPRTSVKTVNWTDTDPQWKGLLLIRLSINLLLSRNHNPQTIDWYSIWRDSELRLINSWCLANYFDCKVSKYAMGNCLGKYSTIFHASSSSSWERIFIYQKRNPCLNV